MRESTKRMMVQVKRLESLLWEGQDSADTGFQEKLEGHITECISLLCEILGSGDDGRLDETPATPPVPPINSDVNSTITHPYGVEQLPKFISQPQVRTEKMDLQPSEGAESAASDTDEESEEELEYSDEAIEATLSEPDDDGIITVDASNVPDSEVLEGYSSEHITEY